MAPVQQRRPVAARAAAPAAAFGDMGFYSAGGGIPEGDYCFVFDVVINQGQDKNGQPRGPQRLGVMLTAFDLNNPGEKPRKKFLGFGSKAMQSWAPNPDTGKGIVPVPGGPGTPLPVSTNWGYFLKSLYDCGLPPGTFQDDISVLDGMWGHLTNIPEPEDRKGFAKDSTGEASDEEIKGPTTIPVITEIKEDGRPWDGTGGLLEGMTLDGEAPAAPAPKPVARPVARPAAVAARPAVAVRKAAPAPVADEDIPTEGGGDDEVMAAEAVKHLSTLLGTNPKPTKTIARTTIFKAVKDKGFANQILARFFESDEDLNGLVDQLGYVVNGAVIVPQQ